MCPVLGVTRSYAWRFLPKGISMTTEKYLICSPTIALFLEEGRHVAHLVPEGAMISIDGKTFNGNKLIEVIWAEKIVMMFTQDLRTRGKKLD
jgi:hypothetical protein